MDWSKFAATGFEVFKVIVEAKTNSELVQATCERDMYKREVDRLNSRLEKIERDKHSNGNKTKNFHGNKSYKDSSKSQGSHARNFNTTGTSSKGSMGYGMNHSAFQKTSPSSSGTFSGSSKNNWKSQDNTSGFNSSGGRGNLRNKGRGRGQGGINK